MIGAWTWRNWLIPWLMLLVSALPLIHTSQLILPSFMFTLAWGLFPIRKQAWLLRKWLVYGAILPFSIWFVLVSPEGYARINGLSIWVFWIPAWYFLFLGMVQLYAMGRGGLRSFVWWNSALVLGLGCMQLDRVSWAACGLWALLWFMDIRRTALANRFAWNLRFGASWSLVVLLALVLWFFQGAIQNRLWGFAMQSSRWNQAKYQMRGFEPASWLGSFASELESPYERQVAVRVYGANAYPYLRAVAYENYAGGIWRVAAMDQVRYPVRNKVEYGVYASTIDAPDPQVWVEPLLKDYGFLFVPLGANTLAVLADSILTNSQRVFKSTTMVGNRGYYFGNLIEDISYPQIDAYAVPEKLEIMLDSVAVEVFAKARDTSLESKLQSLQDWFTQHFRYSLQPRMAAGQDPLRTFFQDREGYCEYFATAATLLLRKEGVAARYVTGFAGPTRIGDVWAYRRADAHAWVEVWDGNHWVNFDPTPPAANPRLSSFTAWEAFRESWASRFGRALHMLREGSWKQIVDQLGTSTQSLMQNVWLWGVLCCGLLAWLGRRLFFRRKASQELMIAESRLKWVKRLQEAESRLRVQGYVREAGESVGEWLQRLPAQADLKAIEALKDYQEHRFIPHAAIEPTSKAAFRQSHK